MREPIRWEAGERAFRENWAVPGAFIFVYAAVIWAKWLRRCLADSWRWLRSQPLSAQDA